MIYTLFVLSPPDIGASNRHALHFARALITAGHDIQCVFFFDAGVLTANPNAEAAQDEEDLRGAWVALANEHKAPLHICVASAARFGVQDTQKRLAAFTVSGLGELVEAGQLSDRVMSFGD